jgi:hypothetical protein
MHTKRSIIAALPRNTHATCLDINADATALVLLMPPPLLPLLLLLLLLPPSLSALSPATCPPPPSPLRL